jgi:hypothetical protein
MGPSHHGMARPRFADGGTAFSMEGSCEYIEYRSRRQPTWGDPSASGLGEVLETPRRNNWHSYERGTLVSDLD